MEEVKVDTEVQEVKRGPGRPPRTQAVGSAPVVPSAPELTPEAEAKHSVSGSVKEPVQEVTDPCWNCGQQLNFGKCEACGFDKGLIHNPDIDSKREAKRRNETS